MNSSLSGQPSLPSPAVLTLQELRLAWFLCGHWEMFRAGRELRPRASKHPSVLEGSSREVVEEGAEGSLGSSPCAAPKGP